MDKQLRRMNGYDPMHAPEKAIEARISDQHDRKRDDEVPRAAKRATALLAFSEGRFFFDYLLALGRHGVG
jgi:hypothetical protein